MKLIVLEVSRAFSGGLLKIDINNVEAAQMTYSAVSVSICNELMALHLCTERS